MSMESRENPMKRILLASVLCGAALTTLGCRTTVAVHNDARVGDLGVDRKAVMDHAVAQVKPSLVRIQVFLNSAGQAGRR